MSGVLRLNQNGRAALQGRRWAALVVALVVVGAAAAYAYSQGHGGLALAATTLTFWLFLAPFMLLVTSSAARDLRATMRARPGRLWLGVLAALLLYLFYAVFTDCFDLAALARLTAFLCVPTALVHRACHLQGRGAPSPGWLDVLAVTAIWMPFDTGFLKSIWAWPAGEAAYVLNTILAVILATMLFVCCRGFRGINTRFYINKQEALVALYCLLAFMLIAIPFGLATDFLTINWQGTAVKLLSAPIGILLFIALPEELLFRGLVQNFLNMRTGRPWLSLISASILFGATHANNGPAPDWRYLLLATIAGGFYGFTYMRSRSLLAAALVHAAVDTIWVLCLHTGVT